MTGQEIDPLTTSEALKPKVTIGLPVYNGENFLKEAIDSILSQTFRNFELIISDNASTDATEKISRDYAAKDPRILYNRNEKNLGVYGNFNKVIELSSGEYFKLLAHDDLMEPEFLEKCTEVLDRDPSVVVVCTRIKGINQDGSPRGELNFRVQADSSDPAERFGAIIRSDQWYPIYGLIRSGVLKKTGQFGIHFSADMVFLAKLSLLGKFKEIPERLTLIRYHPDRGTRRFRYDQLSAFSYATGGEKGFAFPRWRKCAGFFRVVRENSLSSRERYSCYLKILSGFRWRSLLKDVLINLSAVFKGSGLWIALLITL